MLITLDDTVEARSASELDLYFLDSSQVSASSGAINHLPRLLYCMAGSFPERISSIIDDWDICVNRAIFFTVNNCFFKFTSLTLKDIGAGVRIEDTWVYAGYGGFPNSRCYTGLALCHTPMVCETDFPPLNSPLRLLKKVEEAEIEVTSHHNNRLYFLFDFYLISFGDSVVKLGGNICTV